MTYIFAPRDLFGIPLVVHQADARDLIGDLTALWSRQMGHPPGDIDSDLDRLSTFFDPLARGLRLRQLLDSLAPPPVVSGRLLMPPLIMGGNTDLLVTPEGRVALAVLCDLLARVSDNHRSIYIEPDVVSSAEHQVYERYRKWCVQRLDKVLDLRAGEGEAMGLPSMGLLLLLLVNGSQSPETALRALRLRDVRVREEDGEAAQNRDIDERRLDLAVGTIVAAFSDALNPAEGRDARHFSLYGGYALSEARRRLSSVMGTEKENVYIIQDGKDRAIQLIVRELNRPQRTPRTAQVLRAFDLLVEAYRRELPTLAALGMAHERRAETRRLRERLEKSLEYDRRP